MFRDCHIAAQDPDSFLGGEIAFCPKFIEHGSAFFTSSRAIFRCVSPMGYKYHPVSIRHESPPLFESLLFSRQQVLCLSYLATNQRKHIRKNRQNGGGLEQMPVRDRGLRAECCLSIRFMQGADSYTLSLSVFVSAHSSTNAEELRRAHSLPLYNYLIRTSERGIGIPTCLLSQPAAPPFC